MCLLSHARGGEVAFLVIDYARKKAEHYCSLPQGGPAIRCEIPLHHCRMDGDARPHVRPNHWATFTYHMADGTTRASWTPTQVESPQETARRYRLLRATAAHADLEARHRAATALNASVRAAQELHKELNGCPTASSDSGAPAARLHHCRGRRGRGGCGRGRGSGGRSTT